MAGRIAIFILQLAFGGMFIYAGLIKQRDPISFLESVRGFQMLDDPWNAWLAMGLPWLEIFCGACVITGVFCRGALAILCGAILTFIAAFAYAWARGLDVSCGCFGESVPVADYRVAILQRVALLALGATLLVFACLKARRITQNQLKSLAD